MSEIGERVKKIVVEHLGVEPEKVVDSASFIDDLGADSLDTVELVMAFEEEFGCEIPDDAAETILTVGDAKIRPDAEAGYKACKAATAQPSTHSHASTVSVPSGSAWPAAQGTPFPRFAPTSPNPPGLVPPPWRASPLTFRTPTRSHSSACVRSTFGG